MGGHFPKRRVLVLTRFFPPYGTSGGSIRVVKWMRYLAPEGWHFVVLTQDPQKPVTRSPDSCENLLAEIPPTAEVIRVPAPVTLADPVGLGWQGLMAAILWGVRVFWVALRKVREVDVILAVALPFTTAWIGALLSQWTGVPFVLDLKDDFVGNPIQRYKASLRRFLERKAEAWVLRVCRALSVVTPESLEVYRNRYPRFAEKIFCIPNGSDLEEIQRMEGSVPPLDDRVFLVLSAAGRYESGYRDPTSFLQALALFLERVPQARPFTKVIFLGNALSKEYHPLLEQHQLLEVVQNLPAVSRPELVGWLRRANLYFLAQPPGNTTAIAGTLYEYWAAGQAPVLLFAEPGSAQRLVDEKGLGKCFGFHQAQEAADFIENVFKSFLRGERLSIPQEGLERYDRRKLAYEFGELLESVIQSSSRGIQG